jgi:hypothetical protein
MTKGFIYVVTTVGSNYLQSDQKRDVPTVWRDRLVFGPCKVPMRPRITKGDYVFGLSPSGGNSKPRKIVFAAMVTETLSFGMAYEKYQDEWDEENLKPICVRPLSQIDNSEPFPYSQYEHLPGSKHQTSWAKDLPYEKLDRCFICDPIFDSPWLGTSGPVVTGEILSFLRSCRVYGQSVENESNHFASESTPVCYRRNDMSGPLYTGLHLETDKPEVLIALFQKTMPDQLAPIVQSQEHSKVAKIRSRCCR